MLESHPWTDWDEYITDKGFALVDRAYAYCMENNLTVSEQTVLFENRRETVNTNPGSTWGNRETYLYSYLYFTYK